MGKSTFLTPVYLFSSVRTGTGKATMLANLAVYLNNLNYRVAIVDLDNEYPQKLKNSFPGSINLQEYGELSQYLEQADSRYQKNFYFTDTSQISYFPATRLKEPSLLFSDTTFRDFLIQTRAAFDILLINFPSGPSHCEKVSEIIGRTFLWRGSKPASVIVSLSDERSLVNLDKIIQRNAALSYQLQENTLLLFNKVPASPEEQNLSDSVLNTIELRRLFNFSYNYIVSASEEFPHQKLTSVPAVLTQDSYTQQSIASLSRLLSRLGENSTREVSERSNDFAPVLDGEFLEKLSPYLAKIQKSVSRVLLMGKSDIQVFLEENAGSFRIRLRTSSLHRSFKTVQTSVPVEIRQKPVYRKSPEAFVFSSSSFAPNTCKLTEKSRNPVLSINPVFNFDDRFAWKNQFKSIPVTIPEPDKDPCPSPIFFKPLLELEEIPSLAHILGFARKKYKKLAFAIDEKILASGGVTHFFIPPEFNLVSHLSCLFSCQHIADFSHSTDQKINHQSYFVPAYQFADEPSVEPADIPDIFSRNKPFIPENDFLPRETCSASSEFPIKSAFKKKFELKKIQTDVLQNWQWSENIYSVTIPSEPRVAGFLNHSFTPDFFINNELPLAYEKYPEKKSEPIFVSCTTKTEFFDFFEKPFNAAFLTQNSIIFNSFASNSVGNSFISDFTFNKSFSIHDKTLSLFSFASEKHTIEDFLQPETARIKKYINMADQLLDHRFKYFSPGDFPARSYAYLNRHNFISGFDYQTFFPQKPVDKPFETMPSVISLPEALYKQIFRVFISGFKPFLHKLSAKTDLLSYEIFPVSFSPSSDSGYRSSANQSIYSTSAQLDKFIKSRSLKLLAKGPMLCRQSAFKSSFADFKPGVSENTFCHSLAENMLLALLSDFEADKTRFSSIVSPFNAVIKGRDFKFIIRVDQKENCDKAPVFNIPALFYKSGTLAYIPVRSIQRKFHFFCPENSISIKEIPQENLSKIFSHKDPSVNSFNVLLDYYGINIPEKLPMRVKQVETPRIESEVENKINDIICVLSTNAVARKSDFSLTSTFRTGKKLIPDVDKPQLEKFFLKFSALKPVDISMQKTLNLPCSFTGVIDELFFHLLYNIRYERERLLQYNHKLSRSDAKQSAFPKPALPEFNSPLIFLEKQAIGRKVLKQNFNRAAFIVPKLKLRDLMNLARQANERISSLNNRIQS